MISSFKKQTSKVLTTPLYDLIPLPQIVRRLFPRPRVVHSTFFGPRPYLITENDRSQTHLWVKEVREIYYALKKNDLNKAQALVAGGNYKRDVRDVWKILKKEELCDRESLGLVAVALWVLKNQDKWVGTKVVIQRIVKGGMYDLTSFVRPGGQPSCLDTAVLLNVLARECGLSGEIHKTPSPYGHRYFVSKSGRVLDPLWGSWCAGLFRDEKEYRRLTRHKFLRYKVRKFTIEVISRLLFRFVKP